MSSTVEQLTVKVGAELSGLRSGMRRAVNVTETSAQKMRASFMRLSLAVAAVGASFATATVKSLAYAESIADVAKRTNADAELLQVYRRALDQNGGSAQQLDDALQRLTRRFGLFAQDGGGPAAKALNSYFTAQQRATLLASDSTTAFRLIAERFESIDSAAEKAALASALFGEDAGPKLVPLLSQGAKGLDAYEKKYRDLGVVIGTDTVNQAGDASAALRDLSSVIQTQFTVALVENAEEIKTVVQGLLDFTASVVQLFATVNRALNVYRKGTAENMRVRMGDIDKKIRSYEERIKIVENQALPPIGGRQASIEKKEKAINELLEERNRLAQELSKLPPYNVLPENQAAAALPPLSLPPAPPTRTAKQTSAGTTTGQTEGLSIPQVIQGVSGVGDDPNAELKTIYAEAKAAERDYTDFMKDSRRDLNSNLSQLLHSMGDEGKAIAKGLFLIEQGRAFASAIVNAHAAANKALAIDPTGTLSARALAIGYVNAGLIAGQTIASFDGGGFTGHGSRSGGIDGKGGFPAILHPNESVIDHTKGRFGGGGKMTVSVGPGVMLEMDELAARTAKVERMQTNMQRSQMKQGRMS